MLSVGARRGMPIMIPASDFSPLIPYLLGFAGILVTVTFFVAGLIARVAKKRSSAVLAACSIGGLILPFVVLWFLDLIEIVGVLALPSSAPVTLLLATLFGWTCVNSIQACRALSRTNAGSDSAE